MFWLTMRQFIRERQLTGSSDNSQVPMETLSSEGVSPGSWFSKLSELHVYIKTTVETVHIYTLV